MNVEEKSPLLESEQPATVDLKYSPEEENYRSALERKIENTISLREEQHPELDGLTYLQYWGANEEMANTVIKPKKNREDSNYQSGTARSKLLAFLSQLTVLNLSPDISAFDENNVEIANLGEAVEDVIFKSEEIDGDEEKKMLRQYELLKQGDVWCEEIIDEPWKMHKTITGGKFTGQIKGLTWTQRVKKLYSRPSRNIISNLSVFVGDLTIYDANKQPFIFTLEIEDYGVSESKFRNWERWKYVPKTFTAPSFIGEAGEQVTSKAWNLLNTDGNVCVIVRYQDPWSNEYALWVNGVLMTPVGLPLDYINGFPGYNLANQHLEPINAKFAIGNSLMRRLKTQVGLLDEMQRMGVLKTQKSYAPPVLNLSGRVVSRRIFAPAQIVSGLPQGSLVPLMEGQNEGITASEIEMVNMIKEDININSVSPLFQAQSRGGTNTATEVIELQRQAKMMMGLVVLACSLLEWKLSWLRLFNVLTHSFEPEGETLDTETNEIRKKFKVYTREVPLQGKGIGNRMVVPTDQPLPSPQEIRDKENMLESKTGKPVKIVVVNAAAVKSSKNIWQITIKPKEKTTSELSKLMFKAELDALVPFGPMINLDYLADKFARVWEEDGSKLFKKAGLIPQEQMGGVNAKGVAAPPGGPMPEANNIMAGQMKNAVKT